MFTQVRAGHRGAAGRVGAVAGGAGIDLLGGIEEASGRGLALIDDHTELGDGTWGVTCDARGTGNTVYAAMPLPTHHWATSA